MPVAHDRWTNNVKRRILSLQFESIWWRFLYRKSSLFMWFWLSATALLSCLRIKLGITLCCNTDSKEGLSKHWGGVVQDHLLNSRCMQMSCTCYWGWPSKWRLFLSKKILYLPISLNCLGFSNVIFHRHFILSCHFHQPKIWDLISRIYKKCFI